MRDAKPPFHSKDTPPPVATRLNQPNPFQPLPLPAPPLKQRPQKTGGASLLRSLFWVVSCLSAALATLTPSHLPAQTATPAPRLPPDGPLWKAPGTSAAWSVVFKYTTPASELAADFRPSIVNVTLAGENSHYSVQFRRHGVEVWRVAGLAFISEIGSDSVFPHSPVETAPAPIEDGQTTESKASFSSPQPEDISAQDTDWATFGELAWVTPQMYRGRIPLGNQSAFIYADVPSELSAPGAKTTSASTWPAGPLGGIPLQPGIRVLAVDEESRLPMVLQFGDELRQYRFKKATPLKIEFPAKVRQFLKSPLPADNQVPSLASEKSPS